MYAQVLQLWEQQWDLLDQHDLDHNKRLAATAIVLRVRPDQTDYTVHEALIHQLPLEMLFLRRSLYPGDPWSGQVAFPGGKSEQHDLSVYHTACRETLEEIGLDLTEQARVLTRLEPIDITIPGREMVIYPFVFLLNTRQDVDFELQHEIAAYTWISMDWLARQKPQLMSMHRLTAQRPERCLSRMFRRLPIMPAIALNSSFLLWGLTLRQTGSCLLRLEEPALNQALDTCIFRFGYRVLRGWRKAVSILKSRM